MWIKAWNRLIIKHLCLEISQILFFYLFTGDLRSEFDWFDWKVKSSLLDNMQVSKWRRIFHFWLNKPLKLVFLRSLIKKKLNRCQFYKSSLKSVSDISPHDEQTANNIKCFKSRQQTGWCGTTPKNPNPHRKRK